MSNRIQTGETQKASRNSVSCGRQIAFAGNPNCGKTTLFNALTGASLKVANWPGVTVEKKEGKCLFRGERFSMLDLPGTYALNGYTMEEDVARQAILDPNVGVIVNVADASSLERQLFLTLQLLELGKPVVLALNMMDIVRERGLALDTGYLAARLGVPVVPVSAREKTGLDLLLLQIQQALSPTQSNFSSAPSKNVLCAACGNLSCPKRKAQPPLRYSAEIEKAIFLTQQRLSAEYPELRNTRQSALLLLQQDHAEKKQHPVYLHDIAPESLEKQITNEKFKAIETIMARALPGKTGKSQSTDRVDRWLLHPVLGIPVFLAIMALVFFLTFTVGDWLKGGMVAGLSALSGFVERALLLFGAGPWMISLVVEGVLAGVGGILTFLPNIAILFVALAFLEDSGYMARVAYLMDDIMGRCGLSGRAFLPMLLGFGCTVPAVLASRALEDPWDRFRTILVTPFLSCSARLPVYILFSKMFFGDEAFLYAYSMYAVGLLTAIGISLLLSRIRKKTHGQAALLIELPEYKRPNWRTVALYVWTKVKDYLVKAGTIIFVASVLLWWLMNFGEGGLNGEITKSLGAKIGAFLVPALRPAGLGYWQIAVALLSGLAAKELVVASLGVLYGISSVSGEMGMASLRVMLAAEGFTALNAYSLMLFCLLYIPCVAALATIRRESSWKGALFAAALQLGVAWCVSTLFFQIASLFV